MLNVDGWNAIDAVLKARYGDADRLGWDAPMPYRPMGPMPMGQFVTNPSPSTPGTSRCRTGTSSANALTAPYEERGYEFTLGVPRHPGEPLDPDRPASAIRAGALVLDPELGRAQSPLGEVAFLQFVGITIDELHAAQTWNVEGLIEVVAPHLPGLLTDLDRMSLADVPGVANAVRERLPPGRLRHRLPVLPANGR